MGLLRDNPMRGEITLSFEREPDYFRAAAEGAAEAYPIIARDPSSGRIGCVAEVALRHVFVNGAPVRGAYLSNWRMDSAWRERVAFLETGLAFFANLQQERLRADVFYTAILAENTAARRRLERRRPGPGNYHLVDDLVTYLVPTRPLRRSAGFSQVGR